MERDPLVPTMTTHVLILGMAHGGWCWQPTVDRLRGNCRIQPGANATQGAPSTKSAVRPTGYARSLPDDRPVLPNLEVLLHASGND